MTTLDEARSLMARSVRSLDHIELPLAAALGHRLAIDVCSDVSYPPGDVSAMDGYAVRAADLIRGELLPVSHEIQAGAAPGALPRGAAARIFTGAVLPDGADTVVPQEQADVGEGNVRLEPLPARSHVRLEGQIFRSGESDVVR